MKFNERKFPFLKFLDKNVLKTDESVFTEIADWKQEVEEAKRILKYFENKKVPIHYISKPIHDKLCDTNNFLKAKSLLANVPEMVGLILLPEELIPEVTSKDVTTWRPQDLKMNCILFSVCTQATHDLVRWGKTERPEREEYDNDVDYNYELNYYLNGRWLEFLPIQLDRFFFIDQHSIEAVDEEFGESLSQYGRDINGNIIDYLWSFILLYNFTETENKIVHGTDTEKSRRVKVDDEKFLNESANNIEIVDTTYFTKIVRTDPFGVTGHFKVQNFGPGNALSKIIYVSDYKKEGYTRESKINLKRGN